MSRADYIIDTLDKVNEKHAGKALAAAAGAAGTIGLLHLAHKYGHEPGSGGSGAGEHAKAGAKKIIDRATTGRVHPDVMAGKTTHAAHYGGRAHGGRMTSPRAAGAETEHTISRGSYKAPGKKTIHHLKTTSETPTHQKARELSKIGKKEPGTYSKADLRKAHLRGQRYAQGSGSRFKEPLGGKPHYKEIPKGTEYRKNPKKLIHKLTGMSPGGKQYPKGPVRSSEASKLPHFLRKKES